MKVLIVIPVYNEEKIIAGNLFKLNNYVQANLYNYDCDILIADNASADQTGQIAKGLRGQIKNLEYFEVGQKGKGIAVIKSWQKYADEFGIFIFMDADLATDLSALPDLIKAIESGYDLAIGSRYLPKSQVHRTFLRRIFSLAYRLFLKLFLGTKIKDFPCGFKAVSQKVVKEILPRIKNKTWFFDSEMIYLAEKAGFKIKEIPVKWAEPRAKQKDSRVNIVKVSWLYLKEVIKLRLRK